MSSALKWKIAWQKRTAVTSASAALECRASIVAYESTGMGQRWIAPFSSSSLCRWRSGSVHGLAVHLFKSLFNSLFFYLAPYLLENPTEWMSNGSLFSFLPIRSIFVPYVLRLLFLASLHCVQLHIHVRGPSLYSSGQGVMEHRWWQSLSIKFCAHNLSRSTLLGFFAIIIWMIKKVLHSFLDWCLMVIILSSSTMRLAVFYIVIV